MAGIQNTKLKGLPAPRVIKQRGFLKWGLEWTLISSWLKQHLFLLTANALWVNSTDLPGSTVSVFILRHIVSDEPNHMCTRPQIQSSRWKSGSVMVLGDGKETETSPSPKCSLTGQNHSSDNSEANPMFLVWTQTVLLTMSVTSRKFLSQSVPQSQRL